MTFADYLELMQAVVARQGYEGFYPSLYLVGNEDPFQVHDCSLDEEGEQKIAKEFAASLLKESQRGYLAYRAGQRKVEVCLIEDFKITKIMVVQVA